MAAADGSSQRLLFHGPDSLQQLNGVVAGQGIAGTTAGERAGKDGRVVWKVYRDETDELGMRHVFYRQHLMPAGALAEALGEPLASDGIPVLGGEVGVHTLADGTPRAVFGRQYREVGVAAVPAITEPATALAVAMGAAEALDQWAGSRALAWSPPEVGWAHGRTRLVLASDQGGELRLVWEVPVEREDGEIHTVRLDAAIGKALGSAPLSQGGTCTPGPTQASIAAPPQNPSLYTRTLPAAVPTDRPTPWTHEAARKQETGWLPAINVYLRILDPNNPAQQAYQCRTDWHNYWGILPLQSPGGQGRYDDHSAPPPLEVRGRSAGDALYHTSLTMETLRSAFGRCGFTGSCTDPASVVMESSDPGWTQTGKRGMATYEQQPPTRIHGGRGVVVYARHNTIYPNPIYPFEASASLDVIAHEWGHGVAHSVGLPYSGEQAQLHEGFSNVLGHAVEWANHPAGNGFEKADWCFGEDHNTDYWPWWGGDCPSYWSRADVFQEVVNNRGGTTSYYSYHEQHRPTNYDSDPHVRGHMLAVAHYLLSQGGTNPVCGPHPNYAGCTTSVTAQGVTKASKILMRVITGFATPNMQWSDLADLGKLAAWDLYARCYHWKYDAIPEQQSVEQAFAAIGYPSPGGYYTCW